MHIRKNILIIETHAMKIIYGLRHNTCEQHADIDYNIVIYNGF